MQNVTILGARHVSIDIRRYDRMRILAHSIGEVGAKEIWAAVW
jgi:hypothetical protein